MEPLAGWVCLPWMPWMASLHQIFDKLSNYERQLVAASREARQAAATTCHYLKTVHLATTAGHLQPSSEQQRGFQVAFRWTPASPRRPTSLRDSSSLRQQLTSKYLRRVEHSATSKDLATHAIRLTRCRGDRAERTYAGDPAKIKSLL